MTVSVDGDAVTVFVLVVVTVVVPDEVLVVVAEATEATSDVVEEVTDAPSDRVSVRAAPVRALVRVVPLPPGSDAEVVV